MTITGTVKTVQSVVGALNGTSQIPSAGAVVNTRGPAGADGITPTIGENGNWYYGDVDSGYPSRGEKGDPGETPDTSVYALKADIAKTSYIGISNSSTVFVKISDFGAWGTGAWYQKNFSMLISSRAGEMVWVSLAANDSATTARAFRLFNIYTKINALWYSASESAIYCQMIAWCNNVCAHILSNVNGDYVPTVAQASALPSDAVSINIVEFGVTTSGTQVGDTSVNLLLGGAAARPTYNGNDMALLSDNFAYDTGEIKAKNRVAKQSYASSGTHYYKLCDLPVNNSGNYASVIVSGRIGGWVSNNMSYVNALVWNRDTPGIALIDIMGTAPVASYTWGIADLVLHTNSDGSATLYIACGGYYLFDLDVKLYQSTGTISYDGTYTTTTPGGTLSAKASTTEKRAEIVNGKMYVAGKPVMTSSDTETWTFTLDDGSTVTKAVCVG